MELRPENRPPTIEDWIENFDGLISDRVISPVSDPSPIPKPVNGKLKIGLVTTLIVLALFIAWKVFYIKAADPNPIPPTAIPAPSNIKPTLEAVPKIVDTKPQQNVTEKLKFKRGEFIGKIFTTNSVQNYAKVEISPALNILVSDTVVIGDDSLATINSITGNIAFISPIGKYRITDNLLGTSIYREAESPKKELLLIKPKSMLTDEKSDLPKSSSGAPAELIGHIGHISAVNLQYRYAEVILNPNVTNWKIRVGDVVMVSGRAYVIEKVINSYISVVPMKGGDIYDLQSGNQVYWSNPR
jgi:hypothetical protein